MISWKLLTPPYLWRTEQRGPKQRGPNSEDRNNEDRTTRTEGPTIYQNALFTNLKRIGCIENPLFLSKRHYPKNKEIKTPKIIG
jgi:hypothetical protein